LPQVGRHPNADHGNSGAPHEAEHADDQETAVTQRPFQGVSVVSVIAEKHQNGDTRKHPEEKGGDQALAEPVCVHEQVSFLSRLSVKGFQVRELFN
jgi:hypothetical protein